MVNKNILGMITAQNNAVSVEQLYRLKIQFKDKGYPIYSLCNELNTSTGTPVGVGHIVIINNKKFCYLNTDCVYFESKKGLDIQSIYAIVNKTVSVEYDGLLQYFSSTKPDAYVDPGSIFAEDEEVQDYIPHQVWKTFESGEELSLNARKVTVTAAQGTNITLTIDGQESQFIIGNTRSLEIVASISKIKANQKAELLIDYYS